MEKHSAAVWKENSPILSIGIEITSQEFNNYVEINWSMPMLLKSYELDSHMFAL